MSRYLYEQDLSAMKYAILASSRHDQVIREIAYDLGISHLKLRRYVMDRFDMILMENLPARYDQGKALMRVLPFPDREIGTTLYSRAVPLLTEEQMGAVLFRVKKMSGAGSAEQDIVSEGKRMIREAILG